MYLFGRTDTVGTAIPVLQTGMYHKLELQSHTSGLSGGRGMGYSLSQVTYMVRGSQLSYYM